MIRDPSSFAWKKEKKNFIQGIATSVRNVTNVPKDEMIVYQLDGN